MTGQHRTALAAWTSALALGLVAVVLPSAAARLAGWAVTLAGVAVVLVYGHRRGRPRSPVALPADAHLPKAERALVLVCGEHLEQVFGPAQAVGSMLRHGQEASYLAVGPCERLAEVVTALLERQPRRAAQLRVLWVANPSQMSDEQQAPAQLYNLRRQMARLQRLGVRVPLLIASYLPGGTDDLAWFIGQPGQGMFGREAVNHPLRARLHLHMVARWWEETVLPGLCAGPSRLPACRPAGYAALSVPVLANPAQRSLWAGWMARQAGVMPAARRPAEAARLPLPDPLLALDLRQPRAAVPARLWTAAIWTACAAALAAISAAAWHNYALARQVSHDLLQHRAQPEAVITRQRLVADHDQLLQHQRDGVPLSLGLGLYRGAWLQARIAPWLVPSTPSGEPPQALRLPSQALFPTGSAVLSEQAAPALFQALLAIRERHREGGLIIVSGHSDDRGSAAANEQLSRARATAVRDWLQRSGGLAAHCFAVQGLGASEPLASNENEQGRAANRRVDIRLVPEAGACTLAGKVPGTHGAKP